MDSPFIYYKYVTGKNFVGRRKDVTIISNFLSQGENVALIAPAKSGKMSLLQQSLYQMKMLHRNYVVAEVSLLDVRTVQEFLLRLGDAVIRTCANTPGEYTRAVEDHLQGTHFVFDQKVFADSDRIVSLNWDIDKDDIQAMLRLPYKMTAGGERQLYIVLKEFQNLSFAPDADEFFKIFESVMRESGNYGRKQCCFVFMGSQLNAMKEIFTERRFFYRLVEVFVPSEIDEKELKDYVSKGFMVTGKVVDPELMLGACRLFKGNVHYLIHFAAICDHLSRGYIMESVMMDALEMLISIHEPRFLGMMADLTTFQVSLLKAVAEGCTKFSSAEVVRRYALSSSANVKRLKDALIKKEIVTFDAEDIPHIIDPLFEYWVKKRYFRLVG
ncbi:MAG: hypothetical protein K5850_00240 [Bacteroidales bacterium]|nr:hypothetical protein [Bacteroidales bacterium]